MTLQEYSKKVTKLLENYIDCIQDTSLKQYSIEIFTDEVIVELWKLKQKAGIR